MTVNLVPRLILALAGLFAVWLSVSLPTPLGLSAGVVVITLALWATALIPPFLTALIFSGAVIILGLGSPEMVFGGFASGAVWLIIGGFVIGTAIRDTGLGARLARALVPLVGRSYAQLVAVMTLAAMALGFVMPSSVGRAVVLVPIGMALAEQMGLGHGTKGRTGLAVALTLACNMPSFAILPSNIPNMILAGAAETLHDVHFSYLSYLLLHYPVLGVLKSGVIIALVLWLFPDRVTGIEAHAPEAKAEDPRQQTRVAVILLVTLALWMTDTVHGVGPAWIGIATAVVLMLPGVGVVAPKTFNQGVDFGVVLFVVAALGLGGLVNHSGLGALVGQGLIRILPLDPGASFTNFASLTLLATATGLVTTNPGIPTVLTPLAADLAQSTGMSIPAVLMTQVVGFSTAIFPYQLAPLIVGMTMAGERVGQVLRITIPMALVSVIILVPLDWAWWRLLGWL